MVSNGAQFGRKWWVFSCEVVDMRSGLRKVNDWRWFDDFWRYKIKHSKANKKNYVFFPHQEMYFAFTV